MLADCGDFMETHPGRLGFHDAEFADLEQIVPRLRVRLAVRGQHVFPAVRRVAADLQHAVMQQIHLPGVRQWPVTK